VLGSGLPLAEGAAQRPSLDLHSRVLTVHASPCWPGPFFILALPLAQTAGDLASALDGGLSAWVRCNLAYDALARSA